MNVLGEETPGAVLCYGVDENCLSFWVKRSGSRGFRVMCGGLA